jgi:hypothetical protein
MKIKFPLNIVVLFGGTGNVLFQFSYAHRLASEKNHTIYVLKASRKREDHPFELGDFIAQCNHVQEINGFSSVLLRSYLYARNQIASQNSAKLFFSLFTAHKFLYIHEGYYQDQNDLVSVSDDFKNELIGYLEIYKLDKKLPNGFDLVIHLRRGDYEKHSETFGILSSKYFRASIETLAANTALDSIAVFYDSLIGNYQEDFFTPRMVLLGPDEAGALDLLYFFSKSKACIISNSTLSWWGGQLAIMKSATAISPSPWHKALANDFDLVNKSLGFTQVEATYR